MPKCSRCQRELPPESFYADRTHPRREHTSECMDCRKQSISEWKHNNPEKYQEMLARWQEEHREHYLEYQRKWREDHPDYLPKNPPKQYVNAEGKIRCKECGEERDPTDFYWYGPDKRYLRQPCKLCRKGLAT